MTSENDGSLSSAKTAPLKQWRETARLGQLIVNELDLQNANKVLARWMSYRVAELMRRAEAATDYSAKEAAERECQDLIISLWEIRDNWPSGGPIRSLMPTLQLLLADVPPYYQWAQRTELDGAGGLITRLLRLHREELLEIYLLIKDRIPSNIIESIEHLLHEHRADLSEDENDLISFVLDTPQNLLFDKAEATDEEEASETPTSITDVFNELRKSIELEREDFFKAVARVLSAGS